MIDAPDIFIFNTLSKRKEALVTAESDRVTLYVCGPTVYNYSHLGNARPAVVFDLLVNLLKTRYSEVAYARNFTDIDDKINHAAAAEGSSIDTVATRFINAYHRDMDALGVARPQWEPRVTHHIPQIIALIARLLKKGHAYSHKGHVLFSIASYPEYGLLSGRNMNSVSATVLNDPAPYKRHPLDFVLWKPSTDDQPGWDSPWGVGRPGWHVECSAMVGSLFGSTIDIHGGGQDLIFPHHENELAQSTCAYDGQLYCKYWMHNSFVTVENAKMSKSVGNVVLVKDLLTDSSGAAVRFALLMSHYRSPLNWTAARLEESERTIERWQRLIKTSGCLPEVGTHGTQPDSVFLAALRDDLNTPGAIARLHECFRELATSRSTTGRKGIASKILASARMLGLFQHHQGTADTFENTIKPSSVKWIEVRIEQRNIARKAGNFELADIIRSELLARHVRLDDTRSGTTWEAIAQPSANREVV